MCPGYVPYLADAAMEELKVVEFPLKARLNNVPEMLRNLARQYEDGEVTMPLTLIWITIDDDEQQCLQIGCLGENPELIPIIGYLERAKWRVNKMLDNGGAVERTPAA